MSKDEIKSIVRDIVGESLLPSFVKLLEESEKRIERTNEMIVSLADAAKHNQAMYDKHMSALEESRDRLVRNNEELIKANMKLTSLVEEVKNDYKSLIQGYKDELQSAKAMYNRVSEAYVRIAETKSSPGAKAEVRVQQ